jgi:hypothetical protein
MTDSIRLDDLLRAFAALKPRDDDARRRIATMLGFNVEQAKKAEPASPPAERKLKEREPRREVKQSAAPETKATSPQSTPTSVAESATILKPVHRAAAAAPDWVSTVKPLALPQASVASPPALEPLFLPRWTRGILVASTSVSVDSGPMDVAAVVAGIARGREFRRVPRRAIMRMASTVQVLVDASESMVPFSDDQEWLVDRIVTTAGRDRTKVLGISGGEPFLAGDGPRFEWRDYFAHHVPPAGVAVILISDLGIGRVPLTPVASPAQWAAFARELRRRGCFVVPIVPYPPARWPAIVRRALPVVQWDRGTTARTARKAIRHSLAARWNG